MPTFVPPCNKDNEARIIELLSFYWQCSTISLDNVFLKRLDYEQKLSKDMSRLHQERAENLGWLFLIEVLRRHREKIVAAMRAGPPPDS